MTLGWLKGSGAEMNWEEMLKRKIQNTMKHYHNQIGKGNKPIPNKNSRSLKLSDNQL